MILCMINSYFKWVTDLIYGTKFFSFCTSLVCLTFVNTFSDSYMMNFSCLITRTILVIKKMLNIFLLLCFSYLLLPCHVLYSWKILSSIRVVLFFWWGGEYWICSTSISVKSARWALLTVSYTPAPVVTSLNTRTHKFLVLTMLSRADDWGVGAVSYILLPSCSLSFSLIEEVCIHTHTHTHIHIHTHTHTHTVNI
jgi:hypothetical protein